jgi:hypothetical protein
VQTPPFTSHWSHSHVLISFSSKPPDLSLSTPYTQRHHLGYICPFANFKSSRLVAIIAVPWVKSDLGCVTRDQVASPPASIPPPEIVTFDTTSFRARQSPAQRRDCDTLWMHTRPCRWIQNTFGNLKETVSRDIYLAFLSFWLRSLRDLYSSPAFVHHPSSPPTRRPLSGVASPFSDVRSRERHFHLVCLR